MTYTDYYDEYVAIRDKEIAELKRCLEHHGGSFSWDDRPDLCPPTVLINTDFGPGDVQVGKISIKGNSLECHGHLNEDYSDIEFDIEDVCFGSIEFIIIYLPELSSAEILMVQQAAMDLETGNHLLRERSKEQIGIMNELIQALGLRDEERTERQREIVDEYVNCTDYEKRNH